MSNAPEHEGAEQYRTSVAPAALRKLEAGEPGPKVLAALDAYLSEINYGFTPEELERVLGNGDDRELRRERLTDACRAIVLDGTVLGHTPAELIRDPKAHRFAEKSWLERLETGDYEEFITVINEIDEALGHNFRN